MNDNEITEEVMTVKEHRDRPRRVGLFGLLVMLMFAFTAAFAPMASAAPTDTPKPSSTSTSSTPASGSSSASPCPSGSSSSGSSGGASSSPTDCASSSSSSESGNAQATGAASDAWSLYNLASNVSGYFGNMMAPGGAGSSSAAPSSSSAASSPSGSASASTAPTGKVGEKAASCGGNNCWSSILTNPGNGGDVVGYTDDNATAGLKHWWAANNSKSSVTISYDSAKSISGEGITSGSAKGPLTYMYYGAALHALGFDSVSTDIGNSATFTKIMGGAIIAAYVGAALVDGVFLVVLNILKTLNPFQILFGGMHEVNGRWASGMSSGPGVFQELSNWLANIIGTIIDLQWTVLVPLMFVTLVAMIMLSKTFNKRVGIRKYVTRIVFFTIGIPLVGSMYTGSINGIIGSVSNGGTATMGSTRMVLSTFVDTRDWALGSRLLLPTSLETSCKVDVAWNPQQAAPAASSQANARNTALCINSNITHVYMSGSAENPNSNITSSPYTFGDFSSLVPGQVSTSDSSFGKAADQEAWNKSMYATQGKTGSAQSSAAVVGSTISLLNSYMNNEHVAASDFETGVKGYLSAAAISTDGPHLLPVDSTADASAAQPAPADGKAVSPNADIIQSWFTSFMDLSSMGQSNANRNLLLNNGAGLTSDLDLTQSSQDYVRFKSNSSETSCGPKVADDGSAGGVKNAKPTDDGPVANCNMSALSMYNYLNSDFGSSSVTVYSSQTSGSTGSRFMHNSVSAVGTGVMGWLYRADTLVTLALFAFVGFTFALNMLVTNIRRSWQIVSASMGAFVGSLSQIAKLITYSALIILEIIGTLFLFSVFEQLAMVIPDVVSSMATKFIDQIGKGAGSKLSGSVSDFSSSIATSGYSIMGVTVISIAAKVWLMKSSNKHRGQFLDAIEAASTRMIERFIDPGDNSVLGNPNKGNPLAGGHGSTGSGGSHGMGHMGGNMAHSAMRHAGNGYGAVKSGAGALGGGLLGGMKSGRGMNDKSRRTHAASGSGSRSSLLNGQDNPRTSGLHLAETAGVAGVAGAGAYGLANTAGEAGQAGSAMAMDGADASDVSMNTMPDDARGGVDGFSADTAVDNSVSDASTTSDGDAVDMGDSHENGAMGLMGADERAAAILNRGYLDEGGTSTGTSTGDQVNGGVDMQGSAGGDAVVDDASNSTVDGGGGAGDFNTDADIMSGMNPKANPDGSVEVGGPAGGGGVDGASGASNIVADGASTDVSADGAAGVDGVGSSTLADGSKVDGSDSTVDGGSGAGNFNENADIMSGMNPTTNPDGSVEVGGPSGSSGESSNAVAGGSNVSGASSMAAPSEGSAAGPSAPIGAEGIGSAFSAGRDGSAFSAASVEGASNTSVAAADMGRAVNDISHGRVGDAFRDVAAGASSLVGNDSMSERILEGTSGAGDSGSSSHSGSGLRSAIEGAGVIGAGAVMREAIKGERSGGSAGSSGSGSSGGSATSSATSTGSSTGVASSGSTSSAPASSVHQNTSATTNVSGTSGTPRVPHAPGAASSVMGAAASRGMGQQQAPGTSRRVQGSTPNQGSTSRRGSSVARDDEAAPPSSRRAARDEVARRKARRGSSTSRGGQSIDPFSTGTTRSGQDDSSPRRPGGSGGSASRGSSGSSGDGSKGGGPTPV